MLTPLLRGFLLLLSLMPLVAGAAPPADPLWAKAVARAKAADEAGVVPGTVRIETVVSKKDGSVDHTGTVVFRTVDDPAAEGGLGLEIVSALQDGEDVTVEAREEDAKARRKAAEKKQGKADSGEEPAEVSLDYHPFAPSIQGRVTVSRGSEETVGGRRGVWFTFRHTSASGPQSIRGRAWLDAETGTPLRVEATPDPLPKLAESMRTVVFFREGTDGTWLPDRSEISGEGGFLFIRRAVKSVITFSDFRHKGRQESGGRSEGAPPGS